MKFTMRDKICKLIGKYQFLEEDFCSKSFCSPYGQSEEAIEAKMCGQFLADLKKLLEDDEAVEPKEDPRKTAPAGKWCTESAAQTAERVAKEARNNG